MLSLILNCIDFGINATWKSKSMSKQRFRQSLSSVPLIFIVFPCCLNIQWSFAWRHFAWLIWLILVNDCCINWSTTYTLLPQLQRRKICILPGNIQYFSLFRNWYHREKTLFHYFAISGLELVCSFHNHCRTETWAGGGASKSYKHESWMSEGREMQSI